MSLFVLYLLMLKATLTSFSGLASLPMVRNDLIVERHMLTDRQLNAAVVAGRTGPGPNGLYIVSVGYFAAGFPGAIAGLLALITPAFLVLPLIRFVGRRAETPRVRGAIRAMVLASAGLLLSASIPLAADAITGPLSLTIVVVTFAVLSFTRIDTLWLMIGAALTGMAAKLI